LLAKFREGEAMKFKQVVTALIIASACGAGSIAQAETGFEDALNGIKSDMRSARLALRHVNPENYGDLLKKLAKAERQLREAMMTLTYVQESVAGATLVEMTKDDNEVVSSKSFSPSAPVALLPAKPGPVVTPAPPTIPRKRVMPGNGIR
jgi:hypothetical protein